MTIGTTDRMMLEVRAGSCAVLFVLWCTWCMQMCVVGRISVGEEVYEVVFHRTLYQKDISLQDIWNIVEYMRACHGPFF